MFDTCSHVKFQMPIIPIQTAPHQTTPYHTTPQTTTHHHRQEVAEILCQTNRRGKSVRDAASYNAKCREVVKKYGGENVSAPPGDWQAPLPEKHIWQRSWWQDKEAGWTPSGQDKDAGWTDKDAEQGQRQGGGDGWSVGGSSGQAGKPEFEKAKEKARAEQKEESPFKPSDAMPPPTP